MSPPIRPEQTFSPVATTSPQVASIVTELRADIVEGRVKPGAQLGQESLADRFGVSRMPIREAIRLLEAMGFVTVETNKRCKVADLSLADLRDIYDMRAALEPLAMRQAMPHLTNAQIDEAAEIQARIERTDPMAFGTANQDFHMLLYRPCGRPRLLQQLDTLFAAADRYVCFAKASPELRNKSNREHHAMLDACRRRDADAAAKVLARHIGDAVDHFAGQFGD